MSKYERKQYDDSWLDNVQDVITTPTHRMNFFVDNKQTEITVKIEHDDLKAVETIIDEYGQYHTVKAFFESLTTFISELPIGIQLEVNKTNVAHLFKEVAEGERPNARRLQLLLKAREVTLTLSEKPQIRRKRSK